MANKTIPDLTAAASFALSNLFEISDGSAISKKVTGTQVQAGLTGLVPVSRTIGTTAPLAGGGDLSADRVFSIADAAADGATKGAATFLAADFTSAAGVIGIDYANGQSASALNKGFLTAADWTTFNSKASNEAPFVDTTAIVKGSADATKLLRFEIDGFTAGATRIATPPNQDFTIAGINVQQTFTQKQTITPPANTESLVVSGFSLTGANAQSLADLSGTWNTSGVATGIKLNITNTASGAGSKLVDFQIGAATKFSVDKDGAVVASSSVSSTGLIIGASALVVSSAGTTTWTFNAGANVPQIAASGISAGSFKISNVLDPTLAQDAATKAYVDSVAGTAPFVDTTAIVKGSADATKLLRFEVDGFTTLTTRVITPPNSNLTLAGIDIVNAWADGIKQTFNPDGTNAGINVGAHTADPSALVNGDIWYESTLNELHARINGATVALGAGGGASPPFDDGTAIIKGSADPTKLLRIEVDGFTAATTRVATPPNQNFTMAGIDVQQTFTQRQTITPPVNTSALVVSGYSITGDQAQHLLDLNGTWNTTGAPAGIKLNITNTASDASSFLLDLKVNTATKVSINTSGDFVTAGGIQAGVGQFSVLSDGSFQAAGGPFAVDASSNLTINSVLTFNNTPITITDIGGSFQFSSNIGIPSLISFDGTGTTIGDDGTRLVFSSGIQIGTATLDDAAGALESNTFKALTALQAGSIQLTDDGASYLEISTGNSLRFGIAAAAGLLIATHSIRVKDGTGTEYDLLCRTA